MKVYNEIVHSVADFWENPPETYRLLYHWDEFSRDQLWTLMQIWVKQQRPWVLGFPRWLGNIYGNCPVVDVRRLLLEDMDDEDFKDKLFGDGHVGLQRRLALALGLTHEDLEEGPFLPEVMAVYHSMENVSKNRPWLEALACVMGTECLTIGRIPKLYDDMEEYDSKRGGITGPLLKIYKALGLKKEDLAFHWAHDITQMEAWETGRDAAGKPRGTEAKHQTYVIKTLTEHAVTLEDQRRVAEMVRLGHGLYWLRWNGIGRAMGEYLERGVARWGATNSE